MGIVAQMKCAYCGSTLHTIALCPKTYNGSVARDLLRCTYCGSKDHNIKACPKTVLGNAYRSFTPDEVADHFIKDR